MLLKRESYILFNRIELPGLRKEKGDEVADLKREYKRKKREIAFAMIYIESAH